MENFSSGAKRSEKKLPYEMIPFLWETEIAKRFDIGHDKYGVGNWKRAISTNDINFVREFYRHLKEHLGAFLWSLDRQKSNEENEGPIEHLAAIMWNAGCLMYYYVANPELVRKSFSDTLKTKTQENQEMEMANANKSSDSRPIEIQERYTHSTFNESF